MTARLNIHIDRGMMPRSGILNKKFDLFIDDRKIGSLGWGHRRHYDIPAGKHTLTLKYFKYDVYYKLEIQAGEGETINIDSHMDRKGRGFTLFNPADGTTSARNEVGSSQTVQELRQSQKAAKEEWIVGACAFAGAATFMILNLLFGRIVPGGFLGGVLGGGLGALIGMGINALRRKK